jgi:metallo-beta-lactamase family protein
MEIIPLGAAGTVTGSRFLVSARRTRVLLDCGLFQGLKVLRQRNWEPFPADPTKLDAVVLTHAHLDHSGYLPVLVRSGFSGPVLASPATADLLPILLTDAGRLQEEDAEWANRKGFSRHDPALPLFTEADARAAVERVEAVPFGEERRIGGLTFRLTRAGHLLGAASVKVEDADGDSALFSGDLGRVGDPLHPDPVPRPAARRLLMEATYGDRSHPGDDPADALARVIRPSLDRGGVVMIPSFAVGRAQVILLMLHRLIRESRLPPVPLFLNSPMAIRASEVHLKHASELRPPERELRAALDGAEQVMSVDDSKALNRRRGPAIIVAGAGMLTGGRILHHLLAFGADDRNALILVGYQAEGTRGRELLRGERSLRIHGRWVEIGCRIEHLDVLSGHADREGLVEWAARGQEPAGGVFLVHGEPGPADHLRRRLTDRTGWDVQVAVEGRPLA